MSAAIGNTILSLPDQSTAQIPKRNYINNEHGLLSWLLTGDHKRIAILYLISVTFFFMVGGLMALGGSLFQQTPAYGNPVTDVPGGSTGTGTLQQGYLENSNVDVVSEFVQMILAQRAYESNSKVIHVADDMYSQINGMIR